MSPFEPVFMQQFPEFDRERASVRTREQWIAFSRKWFDEKTWPRKTAEQMAADSQRKREAIRLNGRQWVYTQTVYDLSPEARYEYAFTLHDVGDRIRVPEIFAAAKKPEDGWCQECPYCELSTRDIGDEKCPQCGRRLVFAYYGD